MSTPPPVSPRHRWWLRPSIALPVLAVLIAVAAVFTPRPQDARSGDSRLSTYSTSAQGASLLFELAERFGWEPRRQLVPGVPRDSSVILALLSPTVPLSDTETHEILEHVRGGGALLYVLPDDSPLSDSLDVRRGAGEPAVVRGEVGGPIDDACLEESNGALPMWPVREMQLWALVLRDPPPVDIVFAETRPERPFERPRVRQVPDTLLPASLRPRPVAVGFALGAGRIVVVSDPDLLRNDVLRVCRWGADVAAVRMLEYLAAGRRRTLVFDEFHLEHGSRPGTFTAIARFFSRTPEGHALAQLMVAGLVLLLAHAPRLVPPRDGDRLERRSPAEHVQALARAYEKVGATRTAVLRLLHGLRRRVARLGPPPMSDERGAEALLDWVAQRAPAAGDDVAVVRHALTHAIGPRELVRAGAAIRRLETALMHSPPTSASTIARRSAAPALPTTP